jgi:hypothetical protein
MSRLLLPTDKCTWCWAPGAYRNCVHGRAPYECPEHGRWTDLNLVTRGKRAVVKCAHYGSACVVLYADPIADLAEIGSYTVQFAQLGVGQEVYTLPPRQHVCPHDVFDRLVGEMRKGVRPSQNRVPSPQLDTTKPGEAL